jgi:hypothetical protein
MTKVNGNGLVNIGYLLGCIETLGAINPHKIEQQVTWQVPRFAGRTPRVVKVESIPGEPLLASVQQHFQGIEEWFPQITKSCEHLCLRQSLKHANRMLEGLKNGPVSVADFGQMATILCGRLRDELADIFLLQIDHQKAELWDNQFPFGEAAQKSVGSTEDIQQAAYCFALSRWTACVFHLMRVMEITVQKLGDKLGVKLTEEKNWQNILDEVNKAIKSLDPKAESTKQLHASAAHLFNVKVAWRNEVMHPKATYTEQEADDIFKHVRTFVNHLVQIL